MAINLRVACKVGHLVTQAICFSLFLATVCNKRGCQWQWTQVTYAFSAGIISAAFAGLV